MQKPIESEVYAAHLTVVGALQKEISALYDDAIKTFAQLIQTHGVAGVNVSTNPALQAKIQEIVNALSTQTNTIIIGGIDSEWARANGFFDSLATWVIGDRGDLPSSMMQKWFAHNDTARLNFIQRVENGLTLSERIWKMGDVFGKEMEVILESGIYQGKAATQIAKELQADLKEPNRLFRRISKQVGDSNTLLLSKAAQVYNPGKGINRSSYQNALRLARNEVNFSYEGASRLRRIAQDFIVGVKIQVTAHHNPALDKGGVQCIRLQGNYPVTFDFTYKWHVNCLCIATSILKTREELDADLDLIYSGNLPTKQSRNLVAEVPSTYQQYVNENLTKWEKWKNLPRFVANNKNN